MAIACIYAGSDGLWFVKQLCERIGGFTGSGCWTLGRGRLASQIQFVSEKAALPYKNPFITEAIQNYKTKAILKLFVGIFMWA